MRKIVIYVNNPNCDKTNKKNLDLEFKESKVGLES